MSRNYMRVIVANESSATLRLKHASTTGDWTPGGWTPLNQPEASPGQSVWWQAEGESAAGIALSGVEARTWYDVVDAAGTVVGELYVFANSPWIESQYGNTFHVRAPAGYCTAYVDADGQKRGNRAVLEIAFRDTKRVAVPGFTPSVNGFDFSNTWSDALPVVTLGWVWNRMRDALQDDFSNTLGIGWMPEDWIPLTHADSGLCGGMTFTAMDYFAAGLLPDTPSTEDGMFVAPDSESDPLFRHIRDRLLESFDVNGRGSRWLSYSSPVYPDDDEGPLQSAGLAKGKAWVTYREEWPRIRRELDAGRLAPLGLVQTDDFDIGANHQVLAYAYEQSGQVVRLWVYDPNVPAQTPAPAVADDLYLEFDITDTANAISVTRHNAPDDDAAKHIYAILYMDAYTPHLPPGGVVLPPPGRPKLVEIAIDAESFTTGGEADSERTNSCGDVLKTGRWTSRTTAMFTAQATGFAKPSVVWRVNAMEVGEDEASIDIVYSGSTYSAPCRVAPGGRSLTLSSQSAETYRTTVEAIVTDADGERVTASAEFEVWGTYEGLRFEDIRADLQCEVRAIPSPADYGWKPPIETHPAETEDEIARRKEKFIEKATLDPTVGPIDYTIIKDLPTF